jgi:hypothetical protein
VKRSRWDGNMVVDWLFGASVQRRELVARYAWTVTDPATVAFVAEHAGPAVLDPMAGTGYWPSLLEQQGIDVAAYDAAPPGAPGADNVWHRDATTWVPVLASHAPDVAAVHGADRSLLLAWPPYDQPDGADTLRAYPGSRVIYIGESEGGCCGDDAMFAQFASDWQETASHLPVQWAVTWCSSTRRPSCVRCARDGPPSSRCWPTSGSPRAPAGWR